MPAALISFRSAALIGAAAFLTGCSSGPEKPRLGSPEYSWIQAGEAAKKGDYAKVSEHLAKVASSSNEHAAKARAMKMVIDSGLTHGYADLADRYEAGGKYNKAKVDTFRLQTSQLRNAASMYAMQYAEIANTFLEKIADGPVVLALPVPPTGGEEPAAVVRIGNGMLPGSQESKTLERSMMVHGVLATAARATGNGENIAKTRESLASGEVTMDRDAFLRLHANSLFEASQIYSQKKLDYPQRMQVLCQVATRALNGIKAQKPEDKELAKKITEATKKFKS